MPRGGSDKTAARPPYIRLEARRQQVLDAALAIAASRSYQTITIKGLAREIGCSHTVIRRALGDLLHLHQAIEQEARRRGMKDASAKPVLLQMRAIGRLPQQEETTHG